MLDLQDPPHLHLHLHSHSVLRLLLPLLTWIRHDCHGCRQSHCCAPRSAQRRRSLGCQRTLHCGVLHHMLRLQQHNMMETLYSCGASRMCGLNVTHCSRPIDRRQSASVPALDSPALPSSRCCSCCSTEPTNRKQWAQTSASALSEKVYTLICMPLAIAIECRSREHPLRWLDSHSLVDAVLRCHQWRLTIYDLTRNKALHV